MVRNAPPNTVLDVKKSSFKKLSKFLEEKERNGLLHIKELQKGVESIISVDYEHEFIAKHRVVRYHKENKHRQVPVGRQCCGSALVQCGSGSSFLSQCGSGSGSRNPNQCGSGSWLDFQFTKSWIFTGKNLLKVGNWSNIPTQVQKPFWKAGNHRIRIFNTYPDPDLWQPNQCGSGSTTLLSV